MNAIAKLFATAFGAGYSPVAPGTCGTAVAVPLAWALASLAHWQFAFVAVAVTALGIAAAHAADRAWGTHDNQRIVIDEVAGYLLTVVAIDRHNETALLLGFFVFRALDIIKPWPVRWPEANLPGGWGVVLDDALAGVIGGVFMGVLAHFGVLARLPGI